MTQLSSLVFFGSLNLAWLVVVRRIHPSPIPSDKVPQCEIHIHPFIHSRHLWPKSPLSSLLWQGLYLFSERPTNPSSLHCLPLSLLQFTRLLRHGKSIQSKMFPLSSYQTGFLFAHFTFTAQIQFCISAHISLSFVVRFIWSIFSGSSGTLLSGSFGNFSGSSGTWRMLSRRRLVRAAQAPPCRSPSPCWRRRTR